MDKVSPQGNTGSGEIQTIDPAARESKYSVVIPVFNSEAIVGDTIDRTVAFWEKAGLDYEIILVNDGSTDASFEVIRKKGLENPNVIAIDLLHNYGQHTANLCGFEHSSGDYLITMDDDLQNPPEEIIHLINKVHEGHDVVFGQFPEKKHASYRRGGSKIIGLINERLFRKPPDLVLTNFRIIRRDVIDRVCSYRTNFPYIPGLVLMFMTNPANVWTEHHERPVGKSNYNLYRILQLVARILFNYSSYPLRMVTLLGMLAAVGGFLLGTFYFLRGIFFTASVPGWTTMVVLISFFNGVTLLILGMVGEYVVRLINQTAVDKSYHIKEVVSKNE